MPFYQFNNANPGRPLRKQDFTHLMGLLFKTSFQPHLFQAGFRQAGLIPLDLEKPLSHLPESIQQNWWNQPSSSATNPLTISQHVGKAFAAHFSKDAAPAPGSEDVAQRHARVQKSRGECLTSRELRDRLREVEEAKAQKEAEKELRRQQRERKK